MSRVRWQDDPFYEARFRSRFLKYKDQSSDCGAWVGAKSGSGYGEIFYRDRPVRAHKAAWYLEYGYWSEKSLLHSCDNPLCVNVQHLREGTQQDNMDDMRIRGRHVGNRKLSEDQVRDIISSTGILSQKDLSHLYSISRSHVNRIQSGKKWSYLYQ